MSSNGLFWSTMGKSNRKHAPIYSSLKKSQLSVSNIGAVALSCLFLQLSLFCSSTVVCYCSGRCVLLQFFNGVWASNSQCSLSAAPCTWCGNTRQRDDGRKKEYMFLWVINPQMSSIVHNSKLFWLLPLRSNKTMQWIFKKQESGRYE